MSDFRKLEVWRKSHALALNVDRVAGNLRTCGRASLADQMLRAAMSVPTNLVEGTGQRSAKEYARFVRIALNSSSELEYHLMVARDVRAMTLSEHEALSSTTIEIRRMLYGLLRHLNSKQSPAPCRDGPNSR